MIANIGVGSNNFKCCCNSIRNKRFIQSVFPTDDVKNLRKQKRQEEVEEIP